MSNERIMLLIRGFEVPGLRPANQEQSFPGAASADISVANAQILVLTDETGFKQRPAACLKLTGTFSVWSGSRYPVDVVLDIAFVNGHAFFISGNRSSRPSSEAEQMPRSVIRPVTRRAGVTSNAKL